MSKLPRSISGQKVVKALQKAGYKNDHMTGDHIILRQNEEPYRRLTVPRHRSVSIGTLRAIIRQAGLTRDEFLDLL